MHSVQCSLDVEMIGHVCSAPPCHKRVPSVFHLLIMPSFDISSLCHIHRNGSNTWAFNNCYHDEPLFLDFHCSATFTHFETFKLLQTLKLLPTLKLCKVNFHKSLTNFTHCTLWKTRDMGVLWNLQNLQGIKFQYSTPWFISGFIAKLTKTLKNKKLKPKPDTVKSNSKDSF